MSDLSEDDFEALEDKVERMAKEGQAASAPKAQDPHHHFDAARNEQDFEALVSAALDGLPAEVVDQLGDVAIVVSDEGKKEHAYGEFRGRTVAGKQDFFSNFFAGAGPPDQITIFRDTLVRDFGRDPALLRSQVTETVRHEVGHYLGMDEAEVRRLGL